MAIYSVEGKLGTGKTKFCVWRAQQALVAGKRVASNVNLDLAKLVPSLPRATYLRIPDKPDATDLEMIGHGNPESYDEEQNGLLILDELGSWLNSRAFQDKARAGVLDWLIHARKYGWDVYLIVQDSMMIDRQAREALIEYQCRCLRLDKVKVPFIGGLLAAVTRSKKAKYLPRMHLVTARVGFAGNQMVAERWTFRGDNLHSSYDTRQVFRDTDDGTMCFWSPDLPRYRRVRRVEKKLRPGVKPKLPEVDELLTLPPDRRIAAWRARQVVAPAAAGNG